ncbi:MAG: hypothetical protein ACFB0E_06585 [Leptolyngbyaceae cyanobacterium]
MINAPLTIQGGGPLAIADELSLQDINFALMLEAGDWLLAGDVVAIPFDETLALAASYTQMSDRPQPLNDGRLWGAPSFKLKSFTVQALRARSVNLAKGLCFQHKTAPR